MSNEPDSLDAQTDLNHTDQNHTDPTIDCSASAFHDDRPDIGLRSVVVTYDERPDRRTVYPEGLSSIERMSTWLTANDDSFVELDSVR